MKIYIIAAIVLCIVAFIMYGADKSRAKKHKWRIPEKTLLLIGLLGGALGALLGMKLFRHKTQHWYFWVINVIGLFINAFVILYLAGVIHF